MTKRLCAGLLLVAAALLCCPQYADAGRTLPRTKATVTIKGKDHRTLRAYFRSEGVAPDDLDDPIDNILLKALPPSFRTGCRQMIAGWGAKAKGSDELVPRGLELFNGEDSVMYAFVAYTCFSSRPEFGSLYFDERLAVLTIGTKSTSLTLLPLQVPCDTCRGLSTFSIVDDTLRMGGLPVVTIATKQSNDNPCCGSAPASEEVDLYYFRLGPRGITTIANLTDHRKQVLNGADGKDSVSEYSTSRSLEFDPAGNVSKILTAYVISANDKPLRQGTISLIWNRKRQAFDELRN